MEQGFQLTQSRFILSVSKVKWTPASSGGEEINFIDHHANARLYAYSLNNQLTNYGTLNKSYPGITQVLPAEAISTRAK